MAGFRSPNFLKLVIEGKRNLSATSIEKFIHAFQLKAREAEYFRVLVHLNQAKTLDEKKLYAEQLMRFRPYRSIHPLQKEQYDYYSQWYNVPIREWIAVPAFSEDTDWVSKNLTPPISPDQARKALDLLMELGLIERDPSGRLVQADALLSTGDEVTSVSVANYHREMIRKGAEAIERFPPSRRDISSVTLALSEEKLSRVKCLIQQFRKELLAVADQDPDPEGVYQVNFQLFPLTRPEKKETEE
jgi:uncharacterized protein (TIGR02147 family)